MSDILILTAVSTFVCVY